jgi:hypothetical protein
VRDLAVAILPSNRLRSFRRNSPLDGECSSCWTVGSKASSGPPAKLAGARVIRANGGVTPGSSFPVATAPPGHLRIRISRPHRGGGSRAWTIAASNGARAFAASVFARDSHRCRRRACRHECRGWSSARRHRKSGSGACRLSACRLWWRIHQGRRNSSLKKCVMTVLIDLRFSQIASSLDRPGHAVSRLSWSARSAPSSRLSGAFWSRNPPDRPSPAASLHALPVSRKRRVPIGYPPDHRVKPVADSTDAVPAAAGQRNG